MIKENLRSLWKNEYFRTAMMFILIIVVVFGFWYGAQLVLNTQYPALAVASGSMCQVEYTGCDGWSHPFQQTLHVGDLIIVQGVSPRDIKTGYSTGDIIVFYRPKSSVNSPEELIVHRAIYNVTRDGLIYFTTRGDGSPPQSIDHWEDYREGYSWNGSISETLFVGKVVLRIPWVGHIALYMRNNTAGMFIIFLLIIILVIVEFIIPAYTGKESKIKTEEYVEKAFEDKPL